MGTAQHQYLVGYRIELGSSGRSMMHGTADIDGVPVEHVLTVCSRPEKYCDVGRNADGDLVWISKKEDLATYIPPLVTVLEPVLEYDPEVLPPELDSEHELGERRSLVLALTERISQRKRLVIVSGFVSALLVFLGLSLTSQPSKNGGSLEQLATPGSSETPVLVDQPTKPTEAAIDFVVSGKVPGVVIPENASRDSLQATVVSTSGEIVLVDVQAQLNDGLTTFATLLLQKKGTAWRIREVFDPR